MADKDELLPSSSTSTKDSNSNETNIKVVEVKVNEEEKSKEEAKGSGMATKPSKLPNLYNKFIQSMESALSSALDEPPLRTVLKTLDLNGVADMIKAKKAQNIIIMVGAGISTSCGIPDFRSPGTGLYSNLAKYNLPHPEAIFELDFFHNKPEPFFELSRELFPDTLKPSPCHYFMRLLDEKGILRRVYTQNIDSLEVVAGLNKDKVIFAHGSHQTSTCLKCKKKYSVEWFTEFLKKREPLVPYCSCKGIIKPDIVFFGEDLPRKFFKSAINDFPKCDLLIIIGTSLVVQPFAGMIHEVNEEVPRLLINLNPVGKLGKRERAKGYAGLCYGEKDNIRDVFWKGKADDGIYELAELLGLKEELHQMILHGHRKIAEKAESSKDENRNIA